MTEEQIKAKYFTDKMCKKCALVVIDEMINNTDHLSKTVMTDFNKSVFSYNKQYLELVKQQIKNNEHDT